MRNELRAIQRRVGVTFIYITHDQGEALTMSDRIAVMNRGKIEQVGNGRDVYEHPQTSFVASFVGENNGFSGTITKISGDQAEIETSVGRLVGLNKKALAVGTKATLFIRPEAMQFGAQGENNLSGTAADAAYEGMTTHLTMKAHDGSSIVATLTGAPAREFPPQGSSVSFAFATRDALILPA
jgi:spermidine/putrescine transport system ATP-binding protein